MPAGWLMRSQEAAATVRREGLRLDVRRAVTRLADAPADGAWPSLAVEWAGEERPATRGWWRTYDGFVLTVATVPAAPPPERL